MAGENDGDEGGGNQDDDDPDAPPADTPAGKKWREMRKKIKDAEAETAAEKEARIKAETRAETLAEVAKKQGSETKEEDEEPTPKQEDDIQVAEEDEKIITKVLTEQLEKQGLSGTAIKKALDQITQQNQAVANQQALQNATSSLEKEFEDSVPFDVDKTLEYAKEHGYGLIANNVEQALRLAHKEMNEEEFDKWKADGRKPRKEAPPIEGSGSGAKKVEEEEKVEGESAMDFRNAAHDMIK